MLLLEEEEEEEEEDVEENEGKEGEGEEASEESWDGSWDDGVVVVDTCVGTVSVGRGGATEGSSMLIATESLLPLSV